MCQEPCILMWVRSVRPFSKRTRRFLPAAFTSSMRSPTGPRPRRALWNSVTRAPTSALPRVVAARKMVSPSGIFLLQRLRRSRRRQLAAERRALEEAFDPRREARMLEDGGQRGSGDLLTIDARDQEGLAAAALDELRERVRQGTGGVRTIRLVLRQEGLEVVL